MTAEAEQKKSDEFSVWAAVSSDINEQFAQLEAPPPSAQTDDGSVNAKRHTSANRSDQYRISNDHRRIANNRR
jgi:hypothetical protein